MLFRSGNLTMWVLIGLPLEESRSMEFWKMAAFAGVAKMVTLMLNMAKILAMSTKGMMWLVDGKGRKTSLS